MDKAAEYEVLRQLSTADDHLPAIDVLKVAHHGSKTSTSDEWLRAWKPRTAVISVGGHNIYGHPHPQVTERLALAGVHLFRTDLHGEIQMQVRDGIIMYRTKLSEQAADEQ
jgi:competence protein ComEC